jgi:hypothetical protein
LALPVPWRWLVLSVASGPLVAVLPCFSFPLLADADDLFAGFLSIGSSGSLPLSSPDRLSG